MKYEYAMIVELFFKWNRIARRIYILYLHVGILCCHLHSKDHKYSFRESISTDSKILLATKVLAIQEALHQILYISPGSVPGAQLIVVEI